MMWHRRDLVAANDNSPADRRGWLRGSIGLAFAVIVFGAWTLVDTIRASR
jgi:hypothetical protein